MCQLGGSFKNISFAETSLISHVGPSEPPAQKTSNPILPISRITSESRGGPPGSRCCWMLGNTTHCFKKQRETPCRRAGREVQKTCIQLSMRFGFAHSPEHPLTPFSESWACASQQLVVTPSSGVHHPNRSTNKPCSRSYPSHFCAV